VNAPVSPSSLEADLLAGYALLAAYQAKHRAEFPDHSVTAELTAQSADDGLSHYAATISCMRGANLVVFVQAFENTVRETAEAAILGANTVVSENRDSWARKLIRPATRVTHTAEADALVEEYNDRTIDVQLCGERVTLAAHWGPDGDEGSRLHISRDDVDARGNKLPSWVDEDLVSSIENASRYWEAV